MSKNAVLIHSLIPKIVKIHNKLQWFMTQPKGLVIILVYSSLEEYVKVLKHPPTC